MSNCFDRGCNGCDNCIDPESQAPEGGDERAAYVSWLSDNYPRAWPRKDAEHNWQHGHVSALAWQARAALAAQPVALTDEQIARLWSEAYDDATGRRQSLVFARAIEAAHGITQTKEPTNDR